MQSSADMVALVHLIHTWEAEDGALTLLWYYAPLHLSQHVCHVHRVYVASLVPKVVAAPTIVKSQANKYRHSAV